MDFTLPEELRMLRDTVARFVREELLPLARRLEIAGEEKVITPSLWDQVDHASIVDLRGEPMPRCPRIWGEAEPVERRSL